MKNGINYKQSAELAEAGGGPPDEAALLFSAACVAIAPRTTAASIAK